METESRVGRAPTSAADVLVGLVELPVTRGSGTWASRADLGIRPTGQNLLEAPRPKAKGFDVEVLS
jgi:hypothetical protein